MTGDIWGLYVLRRITRYPGQFWRKSGVLRAARAGVHRRSRSRETMVTSLFVQIRQPARGPIGRCHSRHRGVRGRAEDCPSGRGLPDKGYSVCDTSGAPAADRQKLSYVEYPIRHFRRAKEIKLRPPPFALQVPLSCCCNSACDDAGRNNRRGDACHTVWRHCDCCNRCRAR